MLVPFLVFLLVLVIIVFAIFYVVDILGLPAPIPVIVKLVVGVLALILLLQRALPMLGGGSLGI